MLVIAAELALISVTELLELLWVHPQFGQRSYTPTVVTDEQCPRFRHKSKAFYTMAFKLEAI